MLTPFNNHIEPLQEEKAAFAVWCSALAHAADRAARNICRLGQESIVRWTSWVKIGKNPPEQIGGLEYFLTLILMSFLEELAANYPSLLGSSIS